jgi:gustatory receptor
MINPLINHKAFHSGMNILITLDKELINEGIVFNYRNMMSSNVVFFVELILLIVVKFIFDGYVIVYRYGFVSTIYFVTTILPILYSFIQTSQFVLLMKIVLKRFRILNGLLYLELSPLEQRDFTRSSGKKLALVGANGGSEIENRNKIPSILHKLGNLQNFCKLLSKFYGLFFLFMFTSIFICTTIQLYYSYIIIYFMDKAKIKGYSLWSLSICLSDIFANIGILIALVTFCELVSCQFMTTQELIVKLQMNGSKFMTSEVGLKK